MINSLLENMMSLINKNDYYIVFNDGKPIRLNLPEEITVEVNNFFSANEYTKNADTKETDEITKNARFAPTIDISINADIKIIHLNKKEAYIDYHIICAENKKINITNIYYKVTNKAKIKMDIVCKDASCVRIKNITNAYDDLNMYIRSFCMQSSSLQLDDLVISDKIVNYYSAVYLVDEKSFCNMNNIILNTTNKTQNFNYYIIHNTENTESHINTYGVAKNDSHLVVNCCGRILSNAKNSKMYQKTKGLIMDLTSSIISTPILEIDENEVIAYHGAAIGALDEDELYYLMSRGLPKEESERLILNTYIAPFYSDIKDQAILDHINEEVKIQLG